MPGIQESEFQQHFQAAQFTDGDAAAAFRENGEAVSLGARRGVPDLFVLSFATRSGHRIGPFILNRIVATQLRTVLQQEGF